MKQSYYDATFTNGDLTTAATIRLVARMATIVAKNAIPSCCRAALKGIRADRGVARVLYITLIKIASSKNI
jgi:hypothetical protein